MTCFWRILHSHSHHLLSPVPPILIYTVAQRVHFLLQLYTILQAPKLALQNFRAGLYDLVLIDYDGLSIWSRIQLASKGLPRL
jgi:hypothetical protein